MRRTSAIITNAEETFCVRMFGWYVLLLTVKGSYGGCIKFIRSEIVNWIIEPIMIDMFAPKINLVFRDLYNLFMSQHLRSPEHFFSFFPPSSSIWAPSTPELCFLYSSIIKAKMKKKHVPDNEYARSIVTPPMFSKKLKVS